MEMDHAACFHAFMKAQHVHQEGPQINPLVRGRYLVYTSAGDRSSLRNWLSADRHFDLWVTYYGDGSSDFCDCADFYNERRGGKFPNLQDAWRRWPELLRGYEAVLVLDDDIQISSAQIDELFRIRERHDFWVLQPAMDWRGKVSHAITARHPGCEYRLVTYVEMNVPLFRADRLWAFLDVFDPQLVGFGTDLWYMSMLRKRGRAAIIDSIRCLNPHDRQKPGGFREIERLQSQQSRENVWRQMASRHGIDMTFADLDVLAAWHYPVLRRCCLIVKGFLIRQQARMMRRLTAMRFAGQS